MCTGLNKLRRYAGWRSGLEGQSSIPLLSNIPPGGLGAIIDYAVNLSDNADELADIDFDPNKNLDGFIEVLADSLFFEGNAFLSTDKDREQVRVISVSEIECWAADPEEFILSVLTSGRPPNLHLRIPPLDDYGLGTSLLEPAAQEIEDALVNPGEQSWAAVAVRLGFVRIDGTYAPLGGWFNRFLSELDTQLNDVFAPWVLGFVDAEPRRLFTITQFNENEPVLGA